jgi:hypothetical protein
MKEDRGNDEGVEGSDSSDPEESVEATSALIE